MYAQSSTGRMRLLQVFRLGIAGLALVLLLLAIEGGAHGSEWPARLPYVVLIGACLLSVLYSLVTRSVRDSTRFAAVQIVADAVIVSALVYLTGGVYSFAALLYFGVVLAAALCVSERLSFVLASGATVALAIIQISYYLAVLPTPPLLELPFVDRSFLDMHRLRFGRETAYLIAQCLALHMVAVLGSYLARELQHVRILYSEIMERMAEGLVVIDAGRRIVFVNHEARELLGYSKPDPLVGRDFRDVFRRQQDHEILACLTSEQPASVEIDVRTRAGRRRFQVKTTMLRDARRVVRGTIGIFTDLTMRQQIEEAERRDVRLEELKTLALGIAHEVRNPLASIRGCVQELARHEYVDEDDRALIDIVCRESDRLDVIVGEFTRFARLRSPTLASYDLVRLLRDIEVLLVNREGHDGVEVRLDLPESASAVIDATQLQQVFMNLGVNAIEAIGEAEGALGISLAPCRMIASRDEFSGRRYSEVSAYEIAFADTGPGIPADELAHIFVPFYSTKGRGSGLGLPVAERIVKAHGGEVSVSTGPDGTRFTVRIPCQPLTARLADPDADTRTDLPIPTDFVQLTLTEGDESPRSPRRRELPGGD